MESTQKLIDAGQNNLKAKTALESITTIAKSLGKALFVLEAVSIITDVLFTFILPSSDEITQQLIMKGFNRVELKLDFITEMLSDMETSLQSYMDLKFAYNRYNKMIYGTK